MAVILRERASYQSTLHDISDFQLVSYPDILLYLQYYTIPNIPAYYFPLVCNTKFGALSNRYNTVLHLSLDQKPYGSYALF